MNRVNTIRIPGSAAIAIVARVVDDQDLLAFMHTISDGDQAAAERLLVATPELATARLVKGGTRTTAEQFFLGPIRLQLYEGDTALHVAAAAYNTSLTRKLVAGGADLRARNRRGAEPIHAAVTGGPGSSTWAPSQQVDVIRFLIEAGADPEAAASGGVTPLLRAVRNRCSAAVRALLDAGVDPHRTNNNGSSPLDLAGLTTGRGGTGLPEAKAEQANIIEMLESRP
jgi:Ankyrin repeats (many copies)/Ankyrin repeat